MGFGKTAVIAIGTVLLGVTCVWSPSGFAENEPKLVKNEAGSFAESQRKKRQEMMENMSLEKRQYYSKGRQEEQERVAERARAKALRSDDLDGKPPGQGERKGQRQQMEEMNSDQRRAFREKRGFERREIILNELSPEERNRFNEASLEEQKIIMRGYMKSRRDRQARPEHEPSPAQ